MNSVVKLKLSDCIHKRLPALMDGDTVILSEAVLPHPPEETKGGQGKKKWEDTAISLLFPRWAAECIQQNLAWGQELQDGESLKARIETIMKKQGEMDKWKRFLNPGLVLIRHLDLSSWIKWNGGFIELLDLQNWRSLVSPFWLFGFSTGRNARELAIICCDEWARDCWNIIHKCMEIESGGKKIMASHRKTIARLLAEGHAYWKWPVIAAEKPKIIGNVVHILDSGDTSRLQKCLTELLLPPTTRKRSATKILALCTESLAYIRKKRGWAEAFIWRCVHEDIDRTEHEAQLAEEKARVAEAQAKTHQARNEQKMVEEALAIAKAENKIKDDRLAEKAQALEHAELLVNSYEGILVEQGRLQCRIVDLKTFCESAFMYMTKDKMSKKAALNKAWGENPRLPKRSEITIWRIYTDWDGKRNGSSFPSLEECEKLLALYRGRLVRK